LILENDLVTEDDSVSDPSAPLLEFKNVHFSYDESREILHNISFKLERGKTYALVGPTGGGKTTTASLIARLYDASQGTRVA
jgi:ATP-binding cassette subfamily B protein